MINFAVDKILHNPSLELFEQDWAFTYNSNKKKTWPHLTSFSEYDDQPESFKHNCKKLSLDPLTHEARFGFRYIPYPNCTRHMGSLNDDSWGEFSNVYPNTDYFRFVDYLDQEKIPFRLWSVNEAPVDSFYPIGINTYHLNFDYFSEISEEALVRVKENALKILFFYHEADNPYKIKKHLDTLAEKYGIADQQIYFISGNTDADKLPNFYYFFDDEILFQSSIDKELRINFHKQKRSKKFTALVRIHKLWRAIFMSELWKADVYSQGYFSYNQITQDIKDTAITSQPFQREYCEEKYKNIQNFLAAGPFRADDLSDIDHNSFETVVENHYADSYFNIVIETHFRLESGHGTTLTEKILKPLCHNQFFVVVGPPHTLKELRKFGYKTFSRLIDESYDDIEDDQKRMNAVINLCIDLASMPPNELHDLYINLQPEITHNSKLFSESKKERLIQLIDKLNQ